MEAQNKQKLSVVHWIGILVFGGIALLVIFAESNSERQARIEVENAPLAASQKRSDIQSQGASSTEKEIVELLDQFGSEISNSSENHAIVYKESFKVFESEAPAFKSIFKTSHEAFMSRPNADKDKGAYLYNAGRTEIWQALFCKPQVYNVMKKYNLAVISANIENEKGEMQSMAVCVSIK